MKIEELQLAQAPLKERSRHAKAAALTLRLHWRPRVSRTPN